MSETVTHQASPIDEEGIVRCYEHNEKARRFTSNTAANPGRAFFRCGKDRDDPEACKFFKWADSLGLPNNTTSDTPIPHTPTRPRQDDMDISSPRPSQAQRAAQFRSPSVQISPEKRPASRLSPPIDEEAAMARSQRRLDSIKAGIESRTTPSPTITTPLTPSQKQRRSEQIRNAYLLNQPPISALQLPSTPSPCKRSRHDTEPQHQLHVETNLPSIHSSPKVSSESWRTAAEDNSEENPFWSSPRDSGPQEAGPSTLSRLPGADDGTSEAPRPSTPPRTHAEMSRSENNMLLTPPHSSQIGLESGPSITSPGTPTRPRGKGKERETLAQFQQTPAKPEGTFHEQALLGQFPLTATTEPLSANAIEARISELSDIPGYIRKLERKLTASEKSNAAKSKRIATLEGEKQELQAKNRSLEQTVASLKTRT